ncbi:MAG: peptide chain release factor N(5)-glutamine methyltransferase [Myxococcales bacterium]|nr:peptide chain release factor N(5)-glutamine methyltransferase [Myxococcales bacterium]
MNDILTPDQQAIQEVWTVQRLLAWTADWLAKTGSPTPRIDSEFLLAFVLNSTRLQLILRFDQPVQGDELAAFKHLIRRRARHEPVAYILGRRGFHDIEVNVNSAVLVPRPETETLVDFVVAYLHDSAAVAGPVLDLCTGSGCIGLALLREMEKTNAIRDVYATDISAAALEVASANAVSQNRVLLAARGDLFEAVAPDLRFAVIVSNPPYVCTADWSQLEPDVRNFEPRLALDGGADGLDLARRIVAEAPYFLLPGGLLALELGSRAQALPICALAESRGFTYVRPTQVVGSATYLVTALQPY